MTGASDKKGYNKNVNSTKMHNAKMHDTQLHDTQLHDTQLHDTQLHDTKVHEYNRKSFFYSFLMLFFESLVISVFSSESLPGFCFALISLFGLSKNTGFNVDLKKYRFIGLLAFFPFLSWWAAVPFDKNSGFLMYGLFFVIAMYFMFIRAATALILPKTEPGKWFPLAGLFVIAAAGNRFVSIQADLVFLLFTALYIPLLIKFWQSCNDSGRTPKTVNSGKSNFHFVKSLIKPGFLYINLILILSVLISGLICFGINRYRNSIDDFIYELTRLYNPAAGFSENLVLGDMPDLNLSYFQNRVILRVISDTPPGYLRGMIYSSPQKKGGWKIIKSPRRPILPGKSDTLNVLLKGQDLFERILSDDTQCILPCKENTRAKKPAISGISRNTGISRMRVLNPRSLNRFLFVPSSWIGLTLAAHGLETTRQGVLFPDQAEKGEPYDVYYNSIVPKIIKPVDDAHNSSLTADARPESHLIKNSGPDAGLSDTLFSQMTALPKDLSPEIIKISKNLFKGINDPLEKIEILKDFFEQNFKYKIGISVPKNEDPLSWFLKNRVPAHCEYFAAASALILRHQKIPARYVTGFVVLEKNPLADYWIGRNKDSHAWVEAYVKGMGWITVETTPSSGVPGPAESWKILYLTDYLKFCLSRAYSFIKSAGALEIIRALLVNLFFSGFTLVFAAALALIFLYIKIRKKIKKNQIKKEKIALAADDDPLKSRLLKIIATLDRAMNMRGFSRPANMTLNEFSEKISLHNNQNNNQESNQDSSRDKNPDKSRANAKAGALYLECADLVYSKKSLNLNIEQLDNLEKQAALFSAQQP